jgi:EmrB/QacA subfamily drug resistance transporter
MHEIHPRQDCADELSYTPESRAAQGLRSQVDEVLERTEQAERGAVNRKPLILVSLLLAAFVINLDTTIVNVALPSLVRQLHASTSQLQWVVDAFNLLFAASVLAAGSLSDRLGRKGMLLAGLAVFGLASLAGGLMDSSGQLIGARAVMGVGAAMVFPATLSLITNVFTERGERALAIGLWGAVTGAAIAIGPIVGGWLLEVFDWRSIFIAMTPMAGIAVVLTSRYVPTSRQPHAPRSDRAGFALSSAAVGLLIYTVIEAPNQGWTSPRTFGGFALSAVLTAAFVVWEHRTEHPMLDVSLFANPRFSAASASVAISFFALSGFIFLVTQYFQFFKNYGPLSTGVRLLPVASFVAISSILGAKLAVRFGTKLIVTAGLTAMAVFYVWVTTAGVNTSYWIIAAQMVVLGTGMGLTSAPATEAIMGVVPKAKAGVGSAVNDATRLLGGTLGVAVIGSVFVSLYASRLASTLPAGLPSPFDRTAHSSVGGALNVADTFAHSAHPALASAVHSAASSAFFNGFHAADWVAGGVAAAGALMAVALLPAQPTGSSSDPKPAALPSPAPAPQPGDGTPYAATIPPPRAGTSLARGLAPPT